MIVLSLLDASQTDWWYLSTAEILNHFKFEKSSTLNLKTAKGHGQRHTILGRM